MLKDLHVLPQLEMFKTEIASFINTEHELCLLAKEIDWATFEKEIAQTKSQEERYPSKADLYF